MSELLLLKKEDCKSCYKCIRECALKSIRFSENRAQIVERECVYCGHCYVTCPQSAKEIRRDTDKARALIASGRPVIVSLAPSFIADFGVGGLDGMRQALLKLGFADVEETARGARIVKTEYENIVREGRRRLRSKAVPSIFQGLPSSMIYIGVLSLAIYALVGHTVVL